MYALVNLGFTFLIPCSSSFLVKKLGRSVGRLQRTRNQQCKDWIPNSFLQKIFCIQENPHNFHLKDGLLLQCSITVIYTVNKLQIGRSYIYVGPLDIVLYNKTGTPFIFHDHRNKHTPKNCRIWAIANQIEFHFSIGAEDSATTSVFLSFP